LLAFDFIYVYLHQIHKQERMQKLQTKGIFPIKIPKTVKSRVGVLPDTGEVVQVLDTSTSMMDKLPFFKVFKPYVQTMISDFNLNEFRLFFAISLILEKDNDVISFYKSKAMKICNWSHNPSFVQAQKGLIQKGVLKKIGRETYQVNPNILFNGVRIKT